MRLLNTQTLELHYIAAGTLPYAVLSHTWGDEEVSFQDWNARDIDPSIRAKDGFRKVETFCRMAAKAGYEYAWADTCCIDKTSSSELSESINSMFGWYESSLECFVYLSDVSDPTIALDSAFAKSRWFTRGWTLQELIAPEKVIFYTKDWVQMGAKTDHKEIISQITGIDAGSLIHFEEGNRLVSISCRFSWASKRHTTRPEDIAYCLLGIVGVNMPLLYGEGSKAFQRLQEEIMKVSDDQSLLAWNPLRPCGDGLVYYLQGVLAEHPRQFSPRIRNERQFDGFHYWRTPYMMTNKGLQIKLPLVRSETSSTLFYGVLDCTSRGQSDYKGSGVGIPLVCISDDGMQFGRVSGMPLMTLDFTDGRVEGLIRQIYIRQHADGKIPWVPTGSRSGAKGEELANSSRSISGESVGEADDPHCEAVRTITVEIVVLCCLYLFYSTISNLIAAFSHTEAPSTCQQTSISTMLISLLTYVYCRPHFRRLPSVFREGRGSLGPVRRFVDRRWLRSSPFRFADPVEHAIWQSRSRRYRRSVLYNTLLWTAVRSCRAVLIVCLIWLPYVSLVFYLVSPNDVFGGILILVLPILVFKIPSQEEIGAKFFNLVSIFTSR